MRTVALAILTLALPALASAEVIRFEGDGIVSAKVSPSATTAWLSRTEIPINNGFYETRAALISDADHDGYVQWSTVVRRTVPSLWAVADLSSGTVEAATPGQGAMPPMPFPKNAFHRDASGHFTQVVLPLGRAESHGWVLLWARPGVGAWIHTVDDFTPADADGTANQLVFFPTSAMQPIADAPTPPDGVKPGDVFIGMSSMYMFPWFGGRVDPHLDDTIGTGILGFASPRDFIAAEAAETIRLTLMRTGGFEGTVSMRYATADDTAFANVDYEPRAGTITFGPGELLKTIDIPVINETIYGGVRQFRIVLSDSAGAPIEGGASRIVAIADDEPAPTLSVADATLIEGNAGQLSTVIVPVTLHGATRATTRVRYGWYEYPNYGQATSGELVFLPGETRKEVVVSVAGDTKPELEKNIWVSLEDHPQNATLQKQTGIVRVLDDDLPRVTIFDAKVLESAGVVEVALKLVEPGERSITVPFSTSAMTATPSLDYTDRRGTTTFNGESATISILLRRDSIEEKGETFRIDLAPSPEYILERSSATVTIYDTEPPPAAKRKRSVRH